MGAAELVLARFVLFCTDSPSTPVTIAERTAFSILAWTGLVLLWRSGPRLQAQILGAVLVFYPLTYYLDQYSPRYIIAICFAIFLPAGYVLQRLFSKPASTGTPRSRDLAPSMRG